MVKPVFHFSLLFLEHSGTANDMDTIEYAIFATIRCLLGLGERQVPRIPPGMLTRVDLSAQLIHQRSCTP